MTSLRIAVLLMPVLYLLVGCERSEKNKEKGSSGEESRNIASPRVKAGGENSKRQVFKPMSKIQHDMGILNEVVKKLNSYHHDSFSKPAGDALIRTAMRDNVELSEELKNPASIWMTTPEMKKAVIGKFSLMTGLIGVPDPKVTPHLPRFFNHEEQVTNGDVLMLHIVKQASTVADRRVKLEDEHLVTWVALAESKNKVYRYIALLLFDLLEQSPEQAEIFYRAYANEKDEHILNLRDEKVKKSNIEDIDGFLER